MAMVIRLKTGTAKEAIRAEVSRVAVSLTGSGGDRWDTGEGTVGRSFTVVVGYPAGPDGSGEESPAGEGTQEGGAA